MRHDIFDAILFVIIIMISVSIGISNQVRDEKIKSLESGILELEEKINNLNNSIGIRKDTIFIEVTNYYKNYKK